MNAILDKVLALVFERIPFIKSLDGYKRTLGNILLILAAILAAVQKQFPQFEPETITLAITYIGAALRLFGDLHADAKARLTK